MARKSTKVATPTEVKAEAQGAAQAAPEAETPRTTMTKTAAARAAMAEGIESPTEAVAFIKAKYGIEMTAQYFSAIKLNDKKRVELPPAGKPGRKAQSTQGVDGYLAPPTRFRPLGEEPDLLAAMEAMKPLVDALGADKVKRIADLLA